MMKNILFAIILFLFLFSTLHQAAAQNSNETTVVVFDMEGFPQWAKDLRRWEIVAFGTFPISMFVAGLSYDIYRSNNPGGEVSGNEKFKTTVLLAAGISAAVAFADFFIVKGKGYRERRRTENMPTGSVTIDRRMPEPETPDEADESDSIEDDIAGKSAFE